MAVYVRRLSIPKGSFFLLGARGTGKTAYLRSQWPDVARIDLLDEGLYQSYLADISAFHRELSVLPRGSRVIVDEVQRLPALLNEVHRLIEDRRLTFALCGSSARKLRRAGVNLLAGRAAMRTMHPFVPAELGADFDLTRALRSGMLPIVWDAPEPEETLTAYVRAYLKEEIQAEALVRNLGGFARFLPVAAVCHGQIMNVSGIAREAEASRTTVEGFFGILEDTLMGFRLPAYEAKLRLRERAKPKFYLIDPGLVRGIKGLNGRVAPEERGHLFEGLVAQWLRAHHEYDRLYDDIGYWQPTDAKHLEVDFLLRRGSELMAIEVKSSKRSSGRDLAGLNAVASLAGMRRRILVYDGARPQRIDGVDVLPVAAFLRELGAGL